MPPSYFVRYGPTNSTYRPTLISTENMKTHPEHNMIKEVLTDPLLIIGASIAAATNWITEYANPYIGLMAGAMGLVVLILTIIHKSKEITKDNMDIEYREWREEQRKKTK